MMTLEKWQGWWKRIQYHTPPWAWKQDPYLEGITEEQFNYLRNLRELPTDTEVR